jgi:hypothetical protein
MNRSTANQNQRGESMTTLFIWIFLAVAVMGGVVAMFVASSQTTATSGEHTKQQGDSLNTLNRISRDITNANPIVKASASEIVVDINKEGDASKVDRRQYIYTPATKTITERTITVATGTAYDANKFATAKQNKVVEDILPSSVIFRHFDAAAVENNGADISKVARVDIRVSANVAGKGNVDIVTSAAPRNVLGGATYAGVVCPAFGAELNEGGTVSIRWASVSGATGYRVVRNGGTVANVAPDTDKEFYEVIDTPTAAGTVLRYSVTVLSSGTPMNCGESTIILNTEATTLTTQLLPPTTYDASSAPISTAWTNATETNRVKVSWEQISLSRGYQVFKQQVAADGTLIGSGRTLIFNTDDEKVTSYTDTIPAGDAGEKWTYSIKVMARTGDNDQSKTVTVLTYPAPVVDASVKATDYSVNTITWTHDSGLESRGYDVYRSALDNPTSDFKKLNGAPVTSKSYADNMAELGSTYGYYVVAVNSSGFSNQFASKQVQQLQFPADPVMTPVGQSGSRDINDGTNRIIWGAVKSATSYNVLINGQQLTSTKELSADDSSASVKPATQNSYRAIAVNATGSSQGKNAQVVLTQRPSAPTTSVTKSPTLDSTTASIRWNATAGSWCNDQSCAYRQDKFSNAGNKVDSKGTYGTSFDWFGQDWGRHFTYTVSAKNAALFNGGWSNPSNTVSADTYPGDFGVDMRAGNVSGGQKQRYIFESERVTTNTTETDHTLRSQGAAVATVSWSASEGSRKMDWVRTGNGATSWDSNLYLPNSNTLAGTVTNGNFATSLAAPGASYAATVTATSVENDLIRPKKTATVITPADMPQSGTQQIVCSGPWDRPNSSIRTSYDAAMYARRSFAPQSYASRLVDFNGSPRYGSFDHTVVVGKYQDARNVASTSFWQDGNGTSHRIESMAKGSIGNYQSGTWTWIAKGKSAPAAIDSNWVGNATHRSRVGTGMQIFNELNNNPSLSSYWMLTIVDEEATRAGCDKNGGFIEPRDACYEWDGDGVCSQLNQNGVDGRPRWSTK